MKRILLTLVCALASFAAMAQETKTFTDQLVVTVNGSATTQQTSVSVELLDDNYINFVLKNFILSAGEGSEDEMYVGNIEVNNLFLRDNGDYKTFTYNANLKIKEGDLDGVEMWIGPELGNVPLVLYGKLSDDKLYVSIDIDMMASIEQMIYVEFGSDFDAPSVTSTKNLTALLKAEMMSTDAEDYGTTVSLDDTEGFATTLQQLNTGDINLIMNNVSLGIMGESLPLGTLAFPNIEATNRGAYCDLQGSGAIAFQGESGESIGTCPFTLKGKYSDSDLYYKVIVDASSLLSRVFSFTYGSDFAPVAETGTAKEYDDKLIVTVDENVADPMDAHVLVTPLNNGGINFALKNFTMVLNENEMHVGNIEVPDLVVYTHGDYQYFNYTGNIVIAAGDEEGVAEEDYIGPLLGNIPLRMRGRMTDDKLNVVIDIDMEVGGQMQVIHVDFGTEITNAIAGVMAAQSENGRIYDLSGRQVQQMGKGIYIVNGKKVLR